MNKNVTMKKQWPSDQEERPHRSSLASAAAIHARITSLAIAGPSGVSGLSSVTRKHGLTRFSLRRLFGGSFNRKNSGSTRPPTSEPDSHSENSFLAGGVPTTVSAECKDSTSYKEGFRAVFTGQTSSDSESNSLSSARSDLMRATEYRRNQSGTVECPLCLLELPHECFPVLGSCNHRACYDCLQHYLKIEITESRVNISCPHCAEPLHPNDIRMILNDGYLMSKYEEFLLRRVLVIDPDIRWCPAPDCGYAVIANGCASCPKLKCERPGCDTYFCYHCKQEWHPNQTCDQARAQRAHHSPNPRSASVSFSQDSIIQRDDIKLCPCCKALIVKMDDGSCNHMTCSVCGTEFCWLCMKEISDLHYLSPSGCTFWGKKPWSRKKKILWQLGMLVGAPVGIALIAGIAVPAIIIGIPVWVGRQLHAKYSKHNSNKHKRNLVVTSGIIASILVSPILAGIAVGIGVPILLAYVYGVVPISLCRSGGCGVTTSASGVRIEFDEENEMGIGSSVAADGVSVDTAVSHHGANPSIGEVSFGMSTSLSLGSGCHLERVGVIRERESDRESASNTAIAGRSLTGSIASASLAGNTSHKLEIQADVSSNKRFSLSSHSETASVTVSLGERSTNVSLADDASTRALAGSILSYKDCISSAAVTPVEVHVDAQASPEDVHSKDGYCEERQAPNVYYVESEPHPVYYKIQTAAPTRGWWSTKSYCGPPPSEMPKMHLPDNLVRHNSLRNGKEVVVVGFIDEAPGYESVVGNESFYYPRSDEQQESYYPENYPRKCPSPKNFPDCHGEPAPQENVSLRKISMFESKSLDHLIGYCEVCQKIHRPCCPHAHSRHVVGSLRTPRCEVESCNGNCLPSGPPAETVSLKYHATKTIESCAKHERLPNPYEFGNEAGAFSPGGNCYYEECDDDDSATDSIQDVMVFKRSVLHHSMHRRSSPAISHLPYTEEPELAIQRQGRTRPQSAPYPPNSRTDLTSSVDDIHTVDYRDLDS